MNGREARLERREATRILGDRASSVLGELRTNVLTFEQQTRADLNDLQRHVLTLSGAFEKADKDLRLQVHRLWGASDQAHGILSRPFWGRVRWLLTGR